MESQIFVIKYFVYIIIVVNINNSNSSFSFLTLISFNKESLLYILRRRKILTMLLNSQEILQGAIYYQEDFKGNFACK